MPNSENGGRTKKNRHISRLDVLPGGRERVKDCCVDLFGVRDKIKGEELSATKKLRHENSEFSMINEENLEESPSPNKKMANELNQMPIQQKPFDLKLVQSAEEN